MRQGTEIGSNNTKRSYLNKESPPNLLPEKLLKNKNQEIRLKGFGAWLSAGNGLGDMARTPVQMDGLYYKIVGLFETMNELYFICFYKRFYLSII